MSCAFCKVNSVTNIGGFPVESGLVWSEHCRYETSQHTIGVMGTGHSIKASQILLCVSRFLELSCVQPEALLPELNPKVARTTH